MAMRTVLFLWLLIPASIATAAPDPSNDGEQLRSECRTLSTAAVNGDQIAMPQDFGSGVCWGFFLLMQSEIVLVDSTTNQPLFHVCAPAASRTSQIIAVFEKYADDHPEELNKDEMLLAMEALKKAWPCEVPKKKH